MYIRKSCDAYSKILWYMFKFSWCIHLLSCDLRLIYCDVYSKSCDVMFNKSKMQIGPRFRAERGESALQVSARCPSTAQSAGPISKRTSVLASGAQCFIISSEGSVDYCCEWGHQCCFGPKRGQWALQRAGCCSSTAQAAASRSTRIAALVPRLWVLLFVGRNASTITQSAGFII